LQDRVRQGSCPHKRQGPADQGGRPFHARRGHRFSDVPQAGTDFVCVEDEKKARNISEYWIRKERERELARSSKVTLEQLYERIKEGTKEFNVIIKGDVQGSIEALTEALVKLSTSGVKLNVIHSSTGSVTESDVLLASASDAVIIGFKVRPDARWLRWRRKKVSR